jgi:carboxypeptidase Taq
MTSALHPAYDGLAAECARLHRLSHLQSIAHWDQAAYMPPLGASARAAGLSEMAALLHRIAADPARAEGFDRAEQEPLDDWQRANLREMRREWRRATALPEALVRDLSLAAARCEYAWRAQRPANDWRGFLDSFRPLLALVREEATLLAGHTGLARYDALLDRYEPGMTSAEVDRVFGTLRAWLPGLIAAVHARQAASGHPIEPRGLFPIDAQRRLAERVMHLLGFDFGAGRLDASTHPFSGGVPEDVRLTSRWREDDFLQGLMATIHETGHGRYEQMRPREWLGQPVSEARSTAIHESQSLAFEMQLARSRGFVALLAPLVVEAFGAQPAFEADNLYRLATRVVPGPIRVDADEVTYPAHVLLRYEIERALIEGEVEAEDIPALWDEKMRALLGLDTRGNYADGPLQDVHWAEGTFGYFPCYTLGAMYAAQWFAAMRRATPDLDARIAAGNLACVFDWLAEHIWLAASRYTTAELVQRASGEALNPAHLRAHLEARYLA